MSWQPPPLPPSPVPPPSHRLTALQVQPGLLDLLLLLSLPSLLLNRISFSCQSSAAPSLFNNPSLFNEFCYVHRGQRRGANLWFHRRSDQRKPMKVRGWERTHTHTLPPVYHLLITATFTGEIPASHSSSLGNSCVPGRPFWKVSYGTTHAIERERERMLLTEWRGERWRRMLMCTHMLYVSGT